MAGELGFDLTTTDVDAEAAAAGDPALRAEFGDRLPVVLLDGREHSYWELDEPRLRADLGEVRRVSHFLKRQSRAGIACQRLHGGFVTIATGTYQP